MKNKLVILILLFASFGCKNEVSIYQTEEQTLSTKEFNFSESRPVIGDRYEFPIKPGSDEWKRIETIAGRLDKLQIPDAVLASISTEGLLETCLYFPFLVDIFFYTNYQRGFEALVEEFNGFRELLKRPDLTKVLIEKYYWTGQDVENAKTMQSAGKGMFSFRHFVLEFLMAQDVVLNSLNEEQEKTLFLLTLEHKKLKTSNRDIFSGLNDLPTCLLYAKKMTNDNRADGKMMLQLLNFIQVPAHIDRNMVDYLENYVNNTFKN